MSDNHEETAQSDVAPQVKEEKPVLYHFEMDGASRFVRTILTEHNLVADLKTEKVWERRQEFLAMNPAGTIPVLNEGRTIIAGAGNIAFYLDETRGFHLGSRRLMPNGATERAEVRRLMDWFLQKFETEVGALIAGEKIYKRFMVLVEGDSSPDSRIIRAGKENIKYHLSYIDWLISQRNWLAGDHMTFADLAAGAVLSTMDYLGDVSWNSVPNAKDWYQKVKSRPSFRAILKDRVPGLPPATHYEDLDF